MTFIDYFVAAYYHKKSTSAVKSIIEKCGKQYSQAKEEYLTMKRYFSSDELVEWIKERIVFMRFRFISTYCD